MTMLQDRPQSEIIRNNLQIFRESFEDMVKLQNDWVITQDASDSISLAGNTGGSGYLKISKSPTALGTETRLVSKDSFSFPFKFRFAHSISQRVPGQQFSIGVACVKDDGTLDTTIPVATQVAISSISQSGTTLNITTETYHGLVPGDRIYLYGVTQDSRLNYGNVQVSFITDNRTISVTTDFDAGVTIPSLTVGPFASGYILKYDPLFLATDALAIVMEANSADNVRLISRENGSAFLDTVLYVASGYSNGTASNSNVGADARIANFETEMIFRNEDTTIIAKASDSVSTSTVAKRTNATPDPTKQYKIVISAKNNIEGMSRIVSKITSATKAGTTTATIVTETNHGLTTGDYITIRGIRDQTNFADLTTQTVVASVVNATTFTIAFGASYTGVSYGGVVYKHVGQHSSNGAITQVIQAAVRNANSGVLQITGSGSWSGLSAGETVDLMGVRDTAGALVGIDGTYRVLGINGAAPTVLLLADSTAAALSSVNCGGHVIKRTDFRLHAVKVFDYTRAAVEITNGSGAGSDASNALPVVIASTPNIGQLTSGQAAHDAVMAGNPLRIAGRARTSNYTGVANDDVADATMTTVGAQIIKPFSIPEQDWSYVHGSAVTSTTDVALKVAGAAGIKNYITCLQYQNTNATATEVVVKDGSTVIWRGYAAASMAQPATINFDTPLKTTAATVLNFACITTGANVYVNAQGYVAP